MALATYSNLPQLLLCRLHEDTARFYAAEVLIAFEYLQARDIIYRDLKVCSRSEPANLYSNITTP